jgi:protein-disulfide isomerase
MSKGEESSKSGMFEKLVPVLLILTIVMAFGIGVLWQKVSGLEKGETTKAPAAEAQAAQPVATKVTLDMIKDVFSKDVVKFGDAKKKVLFVEIGDPSCPYCHVAGGNNPELAAQVGAQFKYVSAGGTYLPPVAEMKKLVDSGKASYAYVFYPGHGAGEMGTKALYCAFDQGKFWEAHALIYSNKGYDLLNNVVKNDKTQTQKLVDLLGNAVNGSKLKECIDGGKYDARLASDQALGLALGVQGTPGFFVNATNFPGAYNFTDMKSAVDAALK